MTILLLLIPISLALLGLAIWAFVWAVRRGQFDDLDSAALDILADDHTPGQGPASGSPDTPPDTPPDMPSQTPPETSNGTTTSAASTSPTDSHAD